MENFILCIRTSNIIMRFYLVFSFLKKLVEILLKNKNPLYHNKEMSLKPKRTLKTANSIATRAEVQHWRLYLEFTTQHSIENWFTALVFTLQSCFDILLYHDYNLFFRVYHPFVYEYILWQPLIIYCNPPS